MLLLCFTCPLSITTQPRYADEGFSSSCRMCTLRVDAQRGKELSRSRGTRKLLHAGGPGDWPAAEGPSGMGWPPAAIGRDRAHRWIGLQGIRNKQTLENNHRNLSIKHDNEIKSTPDQSHVFALASLLDKRVLACLLHFDYTDCLKQLGRRDYKLQLFPSYMFIIVKCSHIYLTLSIGDPGRALLVIAFQCM